MLSPEMQLVVSLIAVILASLSNVYTFACVLMVVTRLYGLKVPLVNLLWYWSKWPALAYVIFYLPFIFVLDGQLRWFHGLLWAALTFLWWYCKDLGDDEDHKQLKKKMKEKVIEVRGKLVVVAEPAA